MFEYARITELFRMGETSEIIEFNLWLKFYHLIPIYVTIISVSVTLTAISITLIKVAMILEMSPKHHLLEDPKLLFDFDFRPLILASV